MASSATRAGQVCGELGLEEEAAKLFSAALCDASLVDLSAGPRASLTAALRRALAALGPPAPGREPPERAAAEVVAALWADVAWRGAWEAAGHGDDLAGHCPIRQIVGGAMYGLSYGDSSVQHRYFWNFSRLSVHGTMLTDETRTRAYQQAILGNRSDFEGKVVMDVGSGTGMLAFFAVQAGAARVYCVEASRMAEVVQILAEANGWADRIRVVNRVLQEIRDEVPEKVDVIVSETLGNFLFAERGIETVVLARERFLKPGGLMFPSKATLCLAPFSDEALHRTRAVEAKHPWATKDFMGVDFSCLEERARKEIFNRPLHDQFHPDRLRSEPHLEEFDFRTLRVEQLERFSVSFDVPVRETCVLHGLAGWFEVHFEGSERSSILSTSPWDKLTHWWQTCLMLEKPIAVNRGHRLTGSVGFAASGVNSYECHLVMEAEGVRREQAGMDLDDMDGAHQNPSYKTKQLTSIQAVQCVDWPSTAATPSAASNLGDLVQDPFREAKRNARAMPEVAPPARPASPAKSKADGQSQAQSATDDRPFGQQLKVGERLYVLVDEPDMCSQWAKAGAAMVWVGINAGSVLMTPQSQPYTCLVEYQRVGTTVQTRFWMEHAACLRHMRSCVLGHLRPGSRLSESEVAAMGVEALFPLYDGLRAQGVQ